MFDLIHELIDGTNLTVSLFNNGWVLRRVYLVMQVLDQGFKMFLDLLEHLHEGLNV